MKRRAAVILLVTALSAAAQAARAATLKVGDKAPDFTLTDQYGKTIHLASYKGKKNVVLAFYILAFTGG